MFPSVGKGGMGAGGVYGRGMVVENGEQVGYCDLTQATAGAAATADNGGRVAVFSLAIGGLMYAASVGGQKLDYVPRG